MNCFQAVLSAGRRTKTAFCLLAGRLCSDVKYSDDEMDEDEKDGREEVRVCVCVCGEMACVTINQKRSRPKPGSSIVCGIGLPQNPSRKGKYTIGCECLLHNDSPAQRVG